MHLLNDILYELLSGQSIVEWTSAGKTPEPEEQNALSGDVIFLPMTCPQSEEKG